MRGLILALFLSALIGLSVSFNCYQSPTCDRCMDNKGCGWYNYTQTCENIDSGLPLEFTCPGTSPYNGCSSFSNCFDCTKEINNRCGWNGTNCLWKATRGAQLVMDYRKCPYDPQKDNCFTFSSFFPQCTMCLGGLGKDCGWNNETSSCHDFSWDSSIKNPIKIPKNCPKPKGFDPKIYCTSFSSCGRCLTEEFEECAWSLDQKCVVKNDYNGTVYHNATQCPYDPKKDGCNVVKNCKSCAGSSQCGWNLKDSKCWSKESNISGLNSDPKKCPYNPSSDECATKYHHKCFSALTLGKGKCGFFKANNSAFELISKMKNLTLNPLECSSIEDDNPCSDRMWTMARPDECEACVQIEECGWNPNSKICEGLNRRKSGIVLKKSCEIPKCSDMKTCKECGMVEKWQCGWSFMENKCVQAKDRFQIQQFPNMTWNMHEPLDPAIALSCDMEPAQCSDEYMEPYLCNSTSDFPFDVQNCYTNSIVRSPSCSAGFFRVMESTKDFWGKREVKERHLKCCPGFYCPENQICALKCPQGSFCSLSQANYSTTSIGEFKDEAVSFAKKEKEKPVYCLPYLPTLLNPQLGCGGATSAFKCKAGYYCENTTSQVICPEGHFCREASVLPTTCFPPPTYFLLRAIVTCPEGTIYPQYRMSVFVVPFLLIVVPIAYFVLTSFFEKRRATEKIRVQNYRKKLFIQVDEDEEQLLSNDDILLPGVEMSTEPSIDLDTDINSLYIDPVYPLDISFENLSVTLPDGTDILKNIDGTFFAGRLTAIMGPSGSGKTTLLSAIMGKVHGRSGTVLPHIQSCKSVIGFVPQEDVMHRELTVRENLLWSARLRLSGKIPNKIKKLMVDAALDLLGLSGVQDSLIGDENVRGISGGQRKRVNIGIELITCPSILFLDEPTSGLDSSMSLSVCQILKKLTLVKVNVVAVIHQPRYDIFDQFDDILLLRKGGSLVYSGPKSEVIKHFEDQGFNCPMNQNPCDHFLDLISKNNANEIKIRPGVVAEGNKNFIRRETPGFFSQTFWIFIRAILQQWRQLNTLYSDVLLSILSGIISGITYRNVVPNQIPYAAFLLVLVSSLTSVISSLRLYGAEKVVYWRESASGLNNLSYFLGKNLASFPSFFCASFVFLSFYYAISQPRASFGLYFAVLFLNHFCVSGFAHFISIIMISNKAQLFGVVITMVQSSICGFSPTLNSLREISPLLYYFAHLTFCKWFMEAIFIINVERFTEVLEGTRDFMVNLYGYQMDNLTYCFSTLFVIGIFWRMCCILALYCANRTQRR